MPVQRRKPVSVARQTPAEESTMMKKKDVMNGGDVFAGCSFASLGLHPGLCDQLKARLGFEVPTQVQAQAIPVVLTGRHMLVNAATGSVKTIAYLAPIIHQLQKIDPRIERSDGTFGA
ncbi:hypothetical protein SAY86_009688 [Trapa natans]|uniref:ATP-dependent RNA helicase n=1 Tax=Trapa natans TaxID=22666 RepID=A0AAN7QT25_TRANT|nr:hypothetical protein SAY86_009688 [Trapa natans]